MKIIPNTEEIRQTIVQFKWKSCKGYNELSKGIVYELGGCDHD